MRHADATRQEQASRERAEEAARLAPQFRGLTASELSELAYKASITNNPNASAIAYLAARAYKREQSTETGRFGPSAGDGFPAPMMVSQTRR